jgi:hypothetical protein
MSPLQAELERLLETVLEGRATEAELARFHELLRADPGLVAAYVEQMRVHALLEWRGGRAAAALESAAPTSVPFRRSQGHWRRWVAAALLLLSLGGTVLFRPSHPPLLVETVKPPVQGDRIVNSFSVVLAAVLSSMPQTPTQETPGKAMIAPAPVARRVALADAVVVGKVVRIEDKSVTAAIIPGSTQGAEFRIAVVKISDGIQGVKGQTEVRVGFMQPMGPVRPGRPRPIVLQPDQEALLFLSARPDVNFYSVPAYFDVVDKNTPTFAADVAEARRCAKLLADPDAGLKSTSAEERYLTAAMLLSQYRTQRWPTMQPAKEEPADAARSKAILGILADADWNPPQGGNQMFYLNPRALFTSLGLTQADGWQQPGNLADFNAEAQKWLRANKDSYRIKRFVTPAVGN